MLALNFALKKDLKKWISLKIISLKKVALFIHSPYYVLCLPRHNALKMGKNSAKLNKF